MRGVQEQNPQGLPRLARRVGRRSWPYACLAVAVAWAGVSSSSGSPGHHAAITARAAVTTTTLVTTTEPPTTTEAPPPTTAPVQATPPSAVPAPAAVYPTSLQPCGGDLPPCWVAQRESGGNYGAVNPTGCGGAGCYGKWQFAGSWAGRLGLPLDLRTATPEQQDNAARQLWAGGAGCANWAAC